jgi:hypothetical protein
MLGGALLITVVLLIISDIFLFDAVKLDIQPNIIKDKG